MPWCTYTDPELAGIGLNETMARAKGIDYRVWTEYFADNDRSLAEGEDVGRIKMLISGNNRPIGVQIMGPRAGELLGEWVAALNGKVKLSALAGAIHPYPTLSEINKKIVGAPFSEKIFSDRVRKILKFLFRYRGASHNPD
ncbi:MAG: mercuric reductase, partial [Desulfurivibrionaceae bacterium]|nr:mercuric reductase [Desulfurivibrionaceae bacterium]